MLHLNLRKGDSTIRFGRSEWRELDSPNILDVNRVADRLSGKRVLALLHGYNVDDPFDPYLRVAANLRIHCPDAYDEIIGVTAPLSRLSLAFLLAWTRAPEAGQRLASALLWSCADAASLDVEGHSLGCRVALEALSCGLRVRNVILAGAAVDNESIHRDQKYGEAIDQAEHALIAYSRRDDVLRRAYPLARWDRALGLTGPEDVSRVAPHVMSVDLQDSIPAHSAYKNSADFYAAWRALLAVSGKA